MTKRLAIIVAALAVCAGCGQPAPQGDTQANRETETVRYGVPVKAGPMDGILLKDYRPSSSLVVPATHLTKARMPVIDVHAHSSMNDIRRETMSMRG